MAAVKSLVETDATDHFPGDIAEVFPPSLYVSELPLRRFHLVQTGCPAHGCLRIVGQTCAVSNRALDACDDGIELSVDAKGIKQVLGASHSVTQARGFVERAKRSLFVGDFLLEARDYSMGMKVSGGAIRTALPATIW
jgi:hypothetical protein